MQRVLLDQIGPHTRQIPFRLARQRLIQPMRNDQIQHGIAQVFQALVVIHAKTAMRQGALQQGGLHEIVTQAGLQGLELIIHYLLITGTIYISLIF